MSPGATRILAVTPPSLSSAAQVTTGMNTGGSTTHLPPLRVGMKRMIGRAVAAAASMAPSAWGVSAASWTPVLSSIAPQTASSIGTSATMPHSCDRLRDTARANNSRGSSAVPARLIVFL